MLRHPGGIEQVSALDSIMGHADAVAKPIVLVGGRSVHSAQAVGDIVGVGGECSDRDYFCLSHGFFKMPSPISSRDHRLFR